MFKAMTIGTQIIGGFGVVLLCMFALGATGLRACTAWASR